MSKLEQLRLDEEVILLARVEAKGEQFERLTEQLMDVRRQIAAIDSIPTIGEILQDAEFWRRVTQLREMID